MRVQLSLSDDAREDSEIEPSLGDGNLKGGASKWPELLKEIAPRINRVAILFNPGTAPYAEYAAVAVPCAPKMIGTARTTH